MISIIIPVYNQAEKLKKCLGSILSQTILERPAHPYGDPAPFELILVNDGSSDNILEISDVFQKIFALKKIGYKYISQENKGANSARNRGAHEASGNFLLFCDADIIMEPEMLERMLDALEHDHGASYAYSAHYFGYKIFKLWPFDRERLKAMPYIHTTSLIRKEHFPGFDESVKRLQDWDLWLTMLESGHAGTWISDPLFRIETGGTMSSWIPKSFYKLFPFLPTVKKYKQAVEAIRNKHKL